MLPIAFGVLQSANGAGCCSPPILQAHASSPSSSSTQPSPGAAGSGCCHGLCGQMDPWGLPPDSEGGVRSLRKGRSPPCFYEVSWLPGCYGASPSVLSLGPPTRESRYHCQSLLSSALDWGVHHPVPSVVRKLPHPCTLTLTQGQPSLSRALQGHFNIREIWVQFLQFLLYAKHFTFIISLSSVFHSHTHNDKKL